MTLNLAELHRSRLETLLAVEVEYQKKLLALSNQRIQAIKKLLADTDGLHHDLEGDELLSSGDSNQVKDCFSESTKKTKKKKKVTSMLKTTKIVGGKVPRLIDALQMVIKNKRMGAKEAHALLKAKNWLPKSKDPLGYIRYTLSDSSDIFHRVDGERGIYELDPSNIYCTGKTQRVQEVEPEDPPEVLEIKPVSSVRVEPPTVKDSELPPKVSDNDSLSIVEAILNGSIPVDS